MLDSAITSVTSASPDNQSFGAPASDAPNYDASLIEHAGQIVLVINWDVDCEAWWGAWHKTPRSMPRELRDLGHNEHSAPMEVDRFEVVLAWCQAQPGWVGDAGLVALETRAVVPCDATGCYEGVVDVRELDYVPGYCGPRHLKCEECRGRGWVY